ncbi:phosphatidylserine/phosphatidylglycerophosphate/cardiolipin synthase-like enzyme [Cytobacillus oceanisediminis]|uniref:phospholipase D n=1 Tax=Cytobacillus oceanisediminis TaxID=665099 RepID=A0A2V2ZPX5_9BACI|nr:phospholipase D family protein [Cytobacillus oceanisediminis]PWW25789.1 phosphatidylserine/phosphatidylglycerophosphate/cardiolipin synthase-like enzyme [Cytobacillus oceanisediminis]
MQKVQGFIKRKRVWIPILSLILILTATIIYQSNKPLPNGLSFEGDVYPVEDIQFLYDLTYEKKNGKRESDQQIFQRITEAIGEAEDFIVMDMFLFNGYHDSDQDFPDISGKIMDKIIAQKKKHPDMEITVITDRINSSYGSHRVPELEELKENGVNVVFTALIPLRDSNPIYSAFWRVFLQWFGQGGEGWLPNPLAKNAPDVTFRSYLDLMNIKANHRKVFVTEKTGIVTSGNPHNASGFHSNIAFEVKGTILSDLVKTEQAVVDYSASGNLPSVKSRTNGKNGSVKAQVLTEGKIYKHIVKEINEAEHGESIWLGMFYLADREVVNALKDAAERGVKVKMILDPNQNAFGSEKIGLPNIPVAAELDKLGQENIKIRWYNTGFEQYHSKLMYITGKENSIIIAGSANFTRRNLDDLNLETDLKIIAPAQSEVMQDVEAYFHKLWANKGAVYTNDYKSNEKLPTLKYITYRLQKLTQFTTY